jgi:hypothetical protein
MGTANTSLNWGARGWPEVASTPAASRKTIVAVAVRAARRMRFWRFVMKEDQWPGARAGAAADLLLDDIRNRSCLSSLAMAANSSCLIEGSWLLSPHSQLLISSSRSSEGFIAIPPFSGRMQPRPGSAHGLQILANLPAGEDSGAVVIRMFKSMGRCRHHHSLDGTMSTGQNRRTDSHGKPGRRIAHRLPANIETRAGPYLETHCPDER